MRHTVSNTKLLYSLFKIEKKIKSVVSVLLLYSHRITLRTEVGHVLPSGLVCF